MFIDRFFRCQPLGLNYRNFVIREQSPAGLLQRVRDKNSFKRIMREHGVATPETYELIHDFLDMSLVGAFPKEFVLKPNRGSGGKGIILFERQGDAFVNPAGDRYKLKAVERHIRRILDGDFSGHIACDLAIIEERVYPSEKLRFKDALGMPDIRIFCFHFEPVMAMLRYPTRKSKGRSNLTAGGVGIGLELSRGTPTYIHAKWAAGEPRPETIGIPESFAMPKWEEMKETARTCSRLSGLALTGVDIILDAAEQVRVLEVNGRPGLEIQNINEDSLLKRFNHILEQ
ncbi:MAG: hypothetical protein HYX91_02600 [Chloroflexi bacterium]|nr:hypothetical protein [Chloroflexota bacterium]